MNVLTLIPEAAKSDPFWVGSLSMSIALALKEQDPKQAQRQLRRTLDEFLRSPVCSAELAEYLR
jgi:hypothetical protein